MTWTIFTGNPGKIAEFSKIFTDLGLEVKFDSSGYPEIQADTLEEVAEEGCKALLSRGIKPPFLVEDAGFFVASLRGFPGVFSRYVQETIGNGGILRLMDNFEEEHRGAAFKSYLGIIDSNGKFQSFSGKVEGRVATRATGENGFGYDPIFIPNGHSKSFAELTKKEKNELSHRGIAVQKFAKWLSIQPRS